MQYLDVFRLLNKRKVEYAVAGGVAVSLHGYLRFTADLDLVLYLKEENIDKFFDAMSDLEFLPKLPLKKEDFKDAKKRRIWQKEKGMVVFSFFHKKDHLKLVDIFVKEPIRFNLIKKELVHANADGVKIPLVSIKHLIDLKKKSARPHDLIDIANLKQIKRIKNEK